jgi:hypothetical protein
VEGRPLNAAHETSVTDVFLDGLALSSHLSESIDDETRDDGLQHEVDEDDVREVEHSATQHPHHVAIRRGFYGATVEGIDVAIADPLGRIHESVVDLQLEAGDEIIAVELPSQAVLVLEEGHSDHGVHVEQDHGQQESVKHTPNVSADGLQQKRHQADLRNEIQQWWSVPVAAHVEPQQTDRG